MGGVKACPKPSWGAAQENYRLGTWPLSLYEAQSVVAHTCHPKVCMVGNALGYLRGLISLKKNGGGSNLLARQT